LSARLASAALPAPVDVLVAGGGPAALAIGGALAELGVRVRVLAGEDQPWTPNYGLFADEAAACGLGDHLAARWADTDVVLDDARRVTLGRGYARLARRRARAAMLERIERAGGEVRFVSALGAEHAPAGSRVRSSDGAEHGATVVIDATGHRPALLSPGAPARHAQVAVGLSLRVDAHPWAVDRFLMMDWRPARGVGASEDGHPPSFLYAMPFGPDHVFVEETSLLSAPAVPFAALASRLDARLARMGVRPTAIVGHERCFIPMDPGLPDTRQRVVGFGAAAGLVHPATGYQLARSLRLAPTLAAVIARGLGAGQAPAEVAAAAWRAVWPSAQRASRELFRFGAERVAAMDAPAIASFFEAFHALPAAARDGYLAGDAPLSQVTSAMWRAFLRVPGPTKLALGRGGLSLPARLLRSLGDPDAAPGAPLVGSLAVHAETTNVRGT
jgi:lycopene cyclase-like protein